jgi:hypothetical protein
VPAYVDAHALPRPLEVFRIIDKRRWLPLVFGTNSHSI